MSALARAWTGPDSMRCLPMHAKATRSGRALDRLGRSLGELLATAEKLRSRHIALLSLEEKIDTNSAKPETEFGLMLS